MKNYSYFNGLAIKIAENGFTVTPTKGKQPIVRKWQNSKPTDLHWLAGVVARNRYPDANVGIVCGRVVAIDIDELDPIKVEQVKKLAPPTRFERIGRAPKTLLLYQPRDDIPSIKIAGCIDVLSHGKQFVAYGIHPDTGEPYRWIDSHYNPLTAKFEELPLISAADLKAFEEAVCAALRRPVSGFPARSLAAVKTALKSRERARQGEMLGSPLSARIVRDDRGLVVEGREALLASLTMAEYAYAKGVTTADELASRVWARFQGEADLRRPKGSNPRKRWAYADALAKARSTISRNPNLRPPRPRSGRHSASHLHAWRKPGYWTAEQRELHLAEVARRIRTPAVLAVARVMIQALDQSGFCTLPIAEIAARASCSAKTVKDARTKLVGWGLWIRSDGGVYVPSAGARGLNRKQGSGKTKRKQVAGTLQVPPLYHLVGVSDVSGPCPSRGEVGAKQPYQRDFFGAAVLNLEDYRRGRLPPDLAGAVRAEMRARGVTQDELARHLGISQPQLANALAGRFGLSPTPVARLREWLRKVA